jgi:hypothetical protein
MPLDENRFKKAYIHMHVFNSLVAKRAKVYFEDETIDHGGHL